MTDRKEALRVLTGARRYRNARLKQRLTANRQMREQRLGKRSIISCTLDKFLIAEFERAYAAGLRDGARALSEAED